MNNFSAVLCSAVLGLATGPTLAQDANPQEPSAVAPAPAAAEAPENADALAPPDAAAPTNSEAVAPSDAEPAAAEAAVAGEVTGASDGGIEEVVVTANKRVENINKVPITITAISGDDLAERRITSLEDLAAAVPGLAYSSSTANTPIFTLRGVGFNESSLGVYPTVSVYMDQAPMPFPVLSSHSNYDLERVEVLKGPQGTLFGQNSTGGAVNYVAAKPTDTFQAAASVGYGAFNSTDTNAFVSGPITDSLGIRVSGTSHHMDDWQRSATRPDDKNGHQDYLAGRILLDWKASETSRFSLNLNGWSDTSQPQAQQLIAIKPQGGAATDPGIANAELNSVFSGHSPRSADWTNQAIDPATGTVIAGGAIVPGTAKLGDFDPYSDRKAQQAALRGDFDLPNDLTLSALSTYNHLNQTQRTDGDGNSLVTFDLQHSDGSIRSFNQEVRLSNGATSDLKWVVGANYENDKTEEYQLLRYFDNSNYNAGNFYINASGVDNVQKIQSYAAFANVDYTLAPQWTLHAGARYTDSKDRANICSSTIPGGNVDSFFNVLGGLLGTVPFTPVGPSDCYTLNDDNVPGQAFKKSLKENNVSWRGGIDYQFDPETLFYVSASRGFKAGSFPSLAAAVYTGLQPVTQETLTDYEGGIKAQFLDRRVTVNAATFYYDYKDKQLRSKLYDPVFGPLDALVNIPKSSITGAELDVTVRPVRGLTIGAAATYLYSKVIDYTGINLIGEQNVDFSGDVLPFTPKWSGVVNADYRFAMGDGAPFVGLTIHGQSKSVAGLGATQTDYATPTASANYGTAIQPGVTCVFCIDAFATVDARAGYEGNDGRWKVEFWGKNILNKYYWTTVVPSNDSAGRLAGLPATYGVTFTQRF